MMIDQLGTGHAGVRSKPDQHMDRPPGVTGRVDEIGVEISVPQQPLALQDRSHGDPVLDRPEPVSAGEQFGRRGPAKVLAQQRCRGFSGRWIGGKDRENEQSRREYAVPQAEYSLQERCHDRSHQN